MSEEKKPKLFVATKAKDITKQRIEDKSMPLPFSGCWIWLGSKSVREYGEILSHNKKYSAHRASYIAFIGDIPKGMVVCHRCDNVYCVNPDHLFLGTQKDNLQDMAAKGRSTKGEKNPMSKLKENEVKQIKIFLSDNSQTNQSIANKFNVSRQTINLIKQGKRWNYVG